MTTGLWPVQQAIHGQLTDSGELMDMVSGVYDEVPEQRAYPYVAIGEATEEPSEAHDRSGINGTLTLHIWSQYRGYAEAAQILTVLDRLLHRQPLDVEGFQKVSIAQEQHQSMRDPDPKLRHLWARYRIWAEKPPQDDGDEQLSAGGADQLEEAG